MVEQVPIERTTRQLIDEARQRQDAFAQVGALMAGATGTAHDVEDTIEVTVDARGKLLKLWLAERRRLGSRAARLADRGGRPGRHARSHPERLQQGGPPAR
jgi:hypothetical protein